MKRARRLGFARAAAATVAVVALQAAALRWAQPAPYDLAPDSLWPLHSCAVLRAWPCGARPADKYPEAGHLWAALFEEGELALAGPQAAATFAEVGERVRARAAEPGFAPAAALLEEGSGAVDVLSPVAIAGRTSTLILSALLAFSAAAAAGALVGPRLAWSAALFCGLLPGVVHYGATLNVDVPALAFTAASAALVLTARRRGGGARVALAGAAAGLAVATKEPLAAFLPGAFAPLLVAPPARLSRTGVLVRAGVAALAAWVLTSGVLAPEVFRQHLDFIFGEGSQPYRRHDLSPAGMLGTLRETVAALGAATSFVGLGGPAALILLALLRRRARGAAWRVIAAPLGYVLLFLLPAGYVYPRFTLPVGFASAVALTVALARVPAVRIRGMRGFAAMVLALVVGARAVDVVRAKRADPRGAAVAELARRRAPGDEVWIVPDPWFLAPAPPVAAPRRFVRLSALGAELAQAAARPRWLWVALPPSSLLAQRDAAGGFDALSKSAGALGYAVAATFSDAIEPPLARAADGLILPFTALLERAR